jgi:hypothetical protein
MYQRGFHWTDFTWNLILVAYTKICRETPDWLQSNNNSGHFRWRPKYLFIVNNNTKYFVAQQQCRGTNCCITMTALNTFITGRCIRSATVQREVLLRFRGNSGYTNSPRSHMIRTLPVWLVCTLGAILFCDRLWHFAASLDDRPCTGHPLTLRSVAEERGIYRKCCVPWK